MTMTTGTKALAPGDVFTRPHPFTWVKEGEGEFAIERWRPGAWDHVSSGPEDMTMACHAIGSVKFTVISTHRPPGYPERVFFKRQFFMPEDGAPYAPSKLLNCITRKFRKDVEKFPFHYEVVEL